jgi:hypothetical protein
MKELKNHSNNVNNNSLKNLYRKNYININNSNTYNNNRNKKGYIVVDYKSSS